MNFREARAHLTLRRLCCIILIWVWSFLLSDHREAPSFLYSDLPGVTKADFQVSDLPAHIFWQIGWLTENHQFTEMDKFKQHTQSCHKARQIYWRTFTIHLVWKTHRWQLTALTIQDTSNFSIFSRSKHDANSTSNTTDAMLLDSLL